MDARELNAGGVQRLIILTDSSVVSSPVLGEWASIIYAEAPYICEVLMPHDSCQFSISKNGQVFLTSISFEVAKITAELRAWLTQHSERRWLAYILDNNDFWHLVGFPNNGGELFFGQQSGRRGGKNGSTFSIEIASLYLPYITDMGFEELTDTAEKLDLRRYAIRDICLYESDSVDVSFVFRNADNSVQTLAGSTFRLQANSVLDNSVGWSYSMLNGQGLTIVNADTELRLFTSLNRNAGKYNYDIKRTYPDGFVETVMKGLITIEKNVSYD
jgi:hypothetical protein